MNLVTFHFTSEICIKETSPGLQKDQGNSFSRTRIKCKQNGTVYPSQENIYVNVLT